MGSTRIVDDEATGRICAMRERGLSCGQIALKLGVSPGAVAWHCLRQGAEAPKLAGRVLPQTAAGPAVIRRGNHLVRRYSADEDAIIETMARDGATPSEIARRLGRRFNSVVGRMMTLARHQARREAAQRREVA